MDAGLGRPAPGRPDSRDRRGVGHRARTGRRARPGRRPATARGRAVRPRSRPDPRAIRLDPRRRRTTGDGRRPRRRPPCTARHGRDTGRDADRSERGLGRRPRRDGRDTAGPEPWRALAGRPAAGLMGDRRIHVPGHRPARRARPSFRHRRHRWPRRARRRPARRAAPVARPCRPPWRGPPGLAVDRRQRARRMSTADVRLVPARRLITAPVDALFALAPGDRALVSPGDSVVVGAPIAQRVRDPRLDEVDMPASTTTTPRPRGAWTGQPQRGADSSPTGEYVFEWHGRWRIARGDITDAVETPFAGIVREVRSGTGITIRAAGPGIRGIVALGGPTRGRLQLGSDGELRSGGLDVGSAGTILVVGSRVDAETLTRARAMGVCGVIVAGLSSKERRDFLASEARQRAALHRLPPFAVLVLDGATRRPLAGAVQAVLAAMAGHEAAIAPAPPMLVFDRPNLVIPPPPVDLVRIRAGAMSGREGQFIAAVGPRRFPGGVHLEAGIVRLPDGTDAAVPLGDLERFV